MKSGIDSRHFDKSVRPQDDLYRYANGSWLSTTEMPADRASCGIMYELFLEAEAQVKAIIESGEELPYQQATSSGATSVTFRKANLKLEVTPQITPEGSIIMSVDINKDSVGRVTTAGFAINTKHVQTQVLVENGGTVVIGGIFTQSENETENKVPLLGDIPVLGFFFKNNVRSSARSELLVFLTPKVVSDKTALR